MVKSVCVCGGGGAHTYHCPPIKKVGGTYPPPLPPLPTPVHVLIVLTLAIPVISLYLYCVLLLRNHLLTSFLSLYQAAVTI